MFLFVTRKGTTDNDHDVVPNWNDGDMGLECPQLSIEITNAFIFTPLSILIQIFKM